MSHICNCLAFIIIGPFLLSVHYLSFLGIIIIFASLRHPLV